MVTWGLSLVTWGLSLVARGLPLVTWGLSMVTRGLPLVTRGLFLWLSVSLLWEVLSLWQIVVQSYAGHHLHVGGFKAVACSLSCVQGCNLFYFYAEWSVWSSMTFISQESFRWKHLTHLILGAAWKHFDEFYVLRCVFDVTLSLSVLLFFSTCTW